MFPLLEAYRYRLGEVGLVVLDDSGKGELVITPTTESQFCRTLLSMEANNAPPPSGRLPKELASHIDGELEALESTSVSSDSSP